MNITFGIITGGKHNSREKKNDLEVSQRIRQIISSVEIQRIPNYEIIIVGGLNNYKNLKHVRHIEFKEKKDGWITKKKNIITELAKFNNIVYSHDYYSFEKNWYKGLLKFGSKFDIQMNAITDMEGRRYHDWEISKIPGFDMESFLPYEVQDLNQYQYISGGFWIAKKKIMKEFPLNENLYWGQGEDVEWSNRVKQKYSFSMNRESKVRLIKERFADSKREILSEKSIEILRHRKNWKLISHRGNLNGINKKKENSPNYILEAIRLGFDVEIDVWLHKNHFYLGHDAPNYRIDSKFLENNKIWCHAKNLGALEAMSRNPKIHYFWHQEDDVTLTSRNFVWTYPGKALIKNSICVLPEKTIFEHINSLKCVGICSDYVASYK